jgi:hypothetical protein
MAATVPANANEKEKEWRGAADTETASLATARASEVFSLSDVDPALGEKMHRVYSTLCAGSEAADSRIVINNAIDEIGWTHYQTKLFFLNGCVSVLTHQLVLMPFIVQLRLCC